MNNPELQAAIDRLRELQAKAIQGPVFVSHDDTGEDALDTVMIHIDSGLAKIDTGRTSDWDVARFAEWPTAEYIAALYNAAPMLLAAASRSQASDAEVLRKAARYCGRSSIPKNRLLSGALDVLANAIEKGEVNL